MFLPECSSKIGIYTCATATVDYRQRLTRFDAGGGALFRLYRDKKSGMIDEALILSLLTAL